MKNTRIVYLLPGVAMPTLKSVYAGDAPRERLFGAVQLLERGWKVTVCDAQWKGWTAPIRRKLLRWFELPALKTCHALWRADVAVVQGRLAPLILLVSKVIRTRVVYIDAIFEIPKYRLKQWRNKYCLRVADAVICYSARQSTEWSKEYGIPIEKVVSVRYPMDSAFYRRPVIKSPDPSFVISVGRDVGRDFSTLLSAARSDGINVKLVTLPYLLPHSWSAGGRVEVLQRISYSKLFNLYAQSKLAVVPLKSDFSYPSGIRALLEAMLLRTPVVATYTSILAEEFEDGMHLLYVEPGNPVALARAINRILNEPGLAEKLVENAWNKVNRDFGVEQFADTIEGVIMRLSRKA